MKTTQIRREAIWSLLQEESQLPSTMFRRLKDRQGSGKSLWWKKKIETSDMLLLEVVDMEKLEAG